MEALNNREDTLSGKQMDSILNASQSISTYESLIMQLDNINTEYLYNMNESISVLCRRDSIPMDSVKMYLDSIGDFLSTIKLIEIAFQEVDSVRAFGLLEYLRTHTEDTAEMQDYNTLFDNVLLDLFRKRRLDTIQLTNAQIDSLYSIENHDTYAAGIAKYLLSRYADYVWLEQYYPVVPRGEERKMKGRNNKETIEIASFFPNPAQNFITLRFNSSDVVDANLIIMDISGRTLLMKKLDQPDNQISLTELANGVYFVKIEQNGSAKVNKLIINK